VCAEIDQSLVEWRLQATRSKLARDSIMKLAKCILVVGLKTCEKVVAQRVLYSWRKAADEIFFQSRQYEQVCSVGVLSSIIAGTWVM
jgi:hypothetical protein